MPASDPLGRKIRAYYVKLPDQTCIIETAQASGLTLLSKNERNPLGASSFGTGELLMKAAGSGAKKIILGLGGSAVIDGGAGLARACGVRFFNYQGKLLDIHGGKDLIKIKHIDLSAVPGCLKKIKIYCACDVNNPLNGKTGAARVFAPQKGASQSDVRILAENLLHYGSLLEKICSGASKFPGSGAAGGIAAAMKAFFNAKIVPGIDFLLHEAQFEKKCRNADLVITGEGRLDRQTLFNKVPAGIAKIAARCKIPVIAFAGRVELDTAEIKKCGLKAAFSITRNLESEESAMANAAQNLYFTAYNVFNAINIKK
ncbi:MAG TPA: glycerate kinase [Spirochaetia bacterium]|nr:glycerate kinase [Spirochaetia bacterium]